MRYVIMVVVLITLWSPAIGMILSDKGERVYRAISDAERSTALTMFLAIDLLDDCSTYAPNMILFVPDGVDRAGEINKGIFKVRVDTREIMTGVWVSSANNIGDEIMFFMLVTRNNPKLLSDIKQGKTIRFDMKIPGTDNKVHDLFLNFSLKGSAAALKRAHSLCVKAKENDKGFFEDNGAGIRFKKKNDKEYFM